MRFLNALKTMICGTALLTFAVGCGSSSNDQGTTFTHLGYYSGTIANACGGTFPTAISGISLPISVIQGEGSGSENFGGSTALLTVGAQNNLSGQTLRVRRVFYDYYIQGSNVQPPTTSAAMTMLLGPGQSATNADPTQGGNQGNQGNQSNSSLPDSLQGLCNVGFSQVILVPNDILEWVNLNRNSLPEAPFTMEVTSTLEGVSSAGDSYTSNGATVFIVFEPDNTITPATPIVD